MARKNSSAPNPASGLAQPAKTPATPAPEPAGASHNTPPASSTLPGALDGAGLEAGARAPETPAHLHIAARRDGFRRCGRAWPAAGVNVPVSDFTLDEIERLQAEPELVVVKIEIATSAEG